MVERAVTGGIDRLETLTRGLGARDSLHVHQDGPAFHPDALGGDADPGVAGSHDLLAEAGPFGIGVQAAADIEPLDDDRAAEGRGIGRFAHQDPGAVGRTRVGHEGPAAVGGQGARHLVRRRRSRRCELVLYVAETLQVGFGRFAHEHAVSVCQGG